LWYSFSPSDTLNTLATGVTALTAWCRAHGVAVYPLVINGYGNDNMLQSPTLMRTDVADLVRLAATAGYSGFNIDFESLNNPDEAGLDQFVAQLAAGLHAEGKKLIVSVGPRTSAANGYHVYNYESLGQSADYVDLMTYDDHDNGGPSGPVAPIAWVEAIVRYAAATIPHDKILVGLAGYGYNWAADGSTELNDAEAAALAAQYGQTWVGGGVGEDEITYVDANGVPHVVWYENSVSEQAKAALVRQDGLGGVALWDLGEENAAVWPMLAETLP
jgi:spore germination protein YaaH